MRHFVTNICLFTVASIMIVIICALTSSAKMTQFLVEKQSSRIVTRGVKGLDTAKQNINKELYKKVDEASHEAFDRMTILLYDKDYNLSKDEVNEIYKEAVLNILNEKYGAQDDGQITLGLAQCLPQLKAGELSISDDCKPKLYIEGKQVVLKDVTVEFSYLNSYRRENSFEVIAPLKEVTLYDENSELFTYSMVAGKGIYITGNTSTVFGNIYAGVHGPAELRKAEALYGETESYGGLNIMSTQLAVYSDKIVSEGNVNIKGAFVVLGNENQPTVVTAKKILQTDNIASKTVLVLFGEYDQGELQASQKKMLPEATAYLGSIEQYYDSDNDKSYTGKYRKIISATDVTVTSDVTGIVMTPGSIIVEEGVNIEGLLLSGDRIYMQGNNNVVASVEVLRDVIKEELYGNVYEEDSYDTLEETARNSLHLNVKDYLGGIEYRGIKE